VEHNAANQFRVISIVDCGDPNGEDDKVADIKIGRIVAATPDRFNSQDMYWGKSTMDIHAFARDSGMASILGGSKPDDVATTLYFLTDRDINTDVSSPWGSRQPMPHFKNEKRLYALPLTPRDSEKPPEGRFTGGGATELYVDELLERQNIIEAVLEGSGEDEEERRRLSKKFKPLAGAFGWADSFLKKKKRGPAEQKKRMTVEEATEDILEESNSAEKLQSASFPKDMDIDFGPEDLTFARKAYRLASIPQAEYLAIVSQTLDDGSLVLAKIIDGKPLLDLCMAGNFPSDKYDCHSFEGSPQQLVGLGLSTSRKHFYVTIAPTGGIKVVTNTVSGISSLLSDKAMQQSFADLEGIHLSIWPSLEYKQLYSDAWRLLRDYFYDTEMNGVDWPAVHERYFPLVSRCTKREELSDVLAQMASELSALHVFVHGGDTNDPMHGDADLKEAHEIASLGAVLERAPEWKGYRVVSIPERDPDFNVINGGYPVYSPLSDQTLRLSGQQGLKAGDIIVGVNGESLMRVADIHSLMRGMAGESLRLDILRLASGNQTGTETEEDKIDEGIAVESIVTVPLTANHVENLRYRSWEYKTQQLAEQLAAEAGFSVGYVHLESMSGAQAEDSFARGFFPNYNKDAFILDVRHNRGGSIDSWVLDVLQRRPWMYWQSRDYDPTNGGLAWDEQFAFRGHIVVLMDEKTSSDGEGVSRGISELGLGRLIGSRTWGGGIWLSSDNLLVDGGIASVRLFLSSASKSFGSNSSLCSSSACFSLFFRRPRLVYTAINSAGAVVLNNLV
jgi:tricorn protease